MDLLHIRFVDYLIHALFYTDQLSLSVDKQITPVATAGPCAYKKAKKEAIRDAVKAVDERQNREQVAMEEVADEHAQ